MGFQPNMGAHRVNSESAGVSILEPLKMKTCCVHSCVLVP